VTAKSQEGKPLAAAVWKSNATVTDRHQPDLTVNHAPL